MIRAWGTFLLIIVAIAAVFPASLGAASSDPAQSVNRLRVIVSTTSDWTQVDIPAGEVIVNSQGGRTGGSAAITKIDTQKIFIGQNPLGSPSSVEYELLLSTNGVSDSAWKITKGWGQLTHVEVYNINEVDNPVLIASVDNSNANGTAKSLTITGAELSQAGPLSAGAPFARQVFAVYYPWYNTNSWSSNPMLIDEPLAPYSVLEQADVDRVVASAQASGIDGFLSSWQGENHFSNEALGKLINSAERTGDFSTAVYVETRVANAGHTETQPVDPAYVRQWLSYVVNTYGGSSSYVKVDGKPVVFIYWAKSLTAQQWRDEVFEPLRQQGVDAFYIADYTGSSAYSYRDYLAVFDGMHMFNPAAYSNIPWVISGRATETRTYNLLADPAAPRKLWVGTAYPGKDARIYGEGSEAYLGQLFIDRENGALYDYMWNTNLDNNPDWMMVSTWNDYFMNTQIEPSQAIGNHYLDATKLFADEYRNTVADPPLPVETPAMSISLARSYWRDYENYVSRVMTSEFSITNNGPGPVNGLNVVSISSNAGVISTTELPMPLGSLSALQDTVVITDWQVPAGVSSFRAFLWARATAADGSPVYYPGPPPGE